MTATKTFLGRESTIRYIAEVLSPKHESPDGAICIVHGEAGSGKTALLVHAREQLRSDYPDGQIYLDLHYLKTDPLGVEKTIAKIIHTLSPYALLVDDRQELRALYLAALEGKRILVLLDDLFSPNVVSLLAPPASCALLVTSDHPLESLDLPQVALSGLNPGDAEALLVKLCPRIGAFARSLADLCDYQPIALRLAAGSFECKGRLVLSQFLEELRGVANQTTEKGGSSAVLAHLVAQSYALQSPRVKSSCAISEFSAADLAKG